MLPLLTALLPFQGHALLEENTSLRQQQRLLEERYERMESRYDAATVDELKERVRWSAAADTLLPTKGSTLRPSTRHARLRCLLSCTPPLFLTTSCTTCTAAKQHAHAHMR